MGFWSSLRSHGDPEPRSWWSILGIALACGVASEVVYLLYKRVRKRSLAVAKNQNESESRNQIEEVLFFPDVEIACKDHFASTQGCHNFRCRFTHDNNSLSKLYEYLYSAKYSLDVCVFLICCGDLGDLLIEAHKKKVKVRVICDDQQVDISGSQIWKLRKEGINVRTDRSSYLMHHKFVVIDDDILLTGSFNWTRQAISGNQENLMALSTKRIVSLYNREFEKLWKNFDPRNFSDSELHRRDQTA